MLGIILILIILIVFYYINFLHISYFDKIKIKLYNEALARSRLINKPLLVIGSPSSFSGKYYSNKTYGCGDLCVDMNCCKNCKRQICDKIENVLDKLEDNSHVIFESGVLEIVDDINSVIKKMYRVSGGENNIYGSHVLFNNKFYIKLLNFFYSKIGEGSIKRIIIKSHPKYNFEYVKI